MNCTGKGCNGACNQGRECEGSRMATRRVLLQEEESIDTGWTKWVVVALGVVCWAVVLSS